MPLASESSTTSSPEDGLLVVPLVTVPVICAANALTVANRQNASPIIRANPVIRANPEIRLRYLKCLDSGLLLYFDCCLAHVSFNATVRLKTSAPGFESGSTQKYPRRS